MIGSLAGDIIGSVYEFNNIKTKDFPLFSKESFYTDDSIMTIAVACLLYTSPSPRDRSLSRMPSSA